MKRRAVWRSSGDVIAVRPHLRFLGQDAELEIIYYLADAERESETLTFQRVRSLRYDRFGSVALPGKQFDVLYMMEPSEWADDVNHRWIRAFGRDDLGEHYRVDFDGWGTYECVCVGFDAGSLKLSPNDD